MTFAPSKTTSENRRTATYEEYLAITTDNHITEWVNGEVITYMPPTRQHQNILLFLAKLIDLFTTFFDLGHSLVAPFEVRLETVNASREPDFLFIAKEKLSRLDEKRLTGPPDLIIEVISPSSVREDRSRKFSEYEQAGVKEYWILDPRLHFQTIEFYVLNEEGTYEAAELTPDGIYTSTILPNFWLDIHWLWETPQPSVQYLLAIIMLTIPNLPAKAKHMYQTTIDYYESK